MQEFKPLSESYKRVCVCCNEEGNLNEFGSKTHNGKWACACCVKHNSINWDCVMW